MTKAEFKNPYPPMCEWWTGDIRLKAETELSERLNGGGLGKAERWRSSVKRHRGRAFGPGGQTRQPGAAMVFRWPHSRGCLAEK